MKNLKEIILEKLIINKDTSIPDKLSKTFENAQELITALNEYFGNLLKNEIELKDRRAYFPPDGKTLTMGQEVNAHFTIEFKDDSLIRCGLVSGKKRLLMQVGHKTLVSHTHLSGDEYDEELTPFKLGYKFEEDNFEDWINGLNIKTFPLLKEKFNMK